MDRPLRVLHLSHPVDGGVARVVLDIAADQLGRGWDVAVGCPAHGELPDGLRRLRIRHLRWEAAKVKRMAGPRRVRELRRLVAAADPDVVHLHSASAGLAGRLAVRRRRPTLFQPHGWTWQSSDGAFGLVAKGWERYAQRWADRVVCVSDAELRAGRAAGLELLRGVVIANGVDLGRFREQTVATRAQARLELGLASAPTVVCVGRLDEQKGQQVLVAAWPRVLAAVPDARLVLVGDGPARSVLAQLARETGVAHSVELVGSRPDVADWYAAADVVVFSSTHGEGMPLAPLEAQASGRSLVASDLPGVREALADGGGALVPAGSAAAFAAALVPRLQDPQRADDEGRRGRLHVEQSLDLHRSLDLLAALTAEVAARRRA